MSSFDNSAIYLYIFYVSIIGENIDLAVSRTRDSTRYFGLKAMNNQGVPAYIGLGIKF